MQWVFLVIALCTALAELHTGTFYLAGVAVAAFATFLIGFSLEGEPLVVAFVILSAILTSVIHIYRRSRPQPAALADFDIGQSVTALGLSPQGDSLLVSYRGVNWSAVMEDGSVLPPGRTAVIVGKTDKLLRLALPPTPTSLSSTRP